MGEETDAELMQSLSSAEVKIESYLQESLPVASVASERLFSTARLIITDQRNSLDPERAEMLLFLNKNLHLFI